MGARSRNKGARCEREVCRLFARHFGGTWSRVPLSGGWGNRKDFSTCGDIITTLSDFPFTIECKNAEGWHLEQLLTSPEACLIAGWWRQACAEAAEAGKKPMLVFTRNFQPLFVMHRQEDGSLDRAAQERQVEMRVCLGEVWLSVVLLEALCEGLAAGATRADDAPASDACQARGQPALLASPSAGRRGRSAPSPSMRPLQGAHDRPHRLHHRRRRGRQDSRPPRLEP